MQNPATIRLICIKKSYSINGHLFITEGQVCFTPIYDFGASYLNWVSIYINNDYFGAHRACNFMTMAEWREKRIDEILNDD